MSVFSRTLPDQVVVPREPTPEMLRLLSPFAQRLKIHPQDFLVLYDLILKAADMESVK